MRTNAIALTLVVVGACSSQTEPVGSSSAALTPTVGTNAPLVMMNMHEVALTPALDPGMGTWRWVGVFNNVSDPAGPPSGISPNNQLLQNSIGWSVSTDLTGTSWPSPQTPPDGTEKTMWVPTGTPTDGSTFIGWNGDPSVAIVGDPTYLMGPTYGTVLVLTNVIASSAQPDAGADVGMLVSTNGGNTWGSAQYVTDQAIVGGGLVDQPQIVSNPNPPYGTFVTWINSDTYPPGPTAWLTSIKNHTFQPNSSSYNAFWTQPIKINGGGANIIHPKMAVGNVTWCDTSTHELVYLAWPDGDDNRCDEPLGQNTAPFMVSWSLAVWDNTANAWLGPFAPFDVDPNWPPCISVQQQPAYTNNANVSLAATTAASGTGLWRLHMTEAPIGTRIIVKTFQPQCSGGGFNLGLLQSFQAPDFCYDSNGGLAPAGASLHRETRVAETAAGTNVTNDQWAPQIAFLQKGPHAGASRHVVRHERRSSQRRRTRQHGAEHERLHGKPIRQRCKLLDLPVVSPRYPVDQIPWPITNASGYRAEWWDYHAIGVDRLVSQSFFAAWGATSGPTVTPARLAFWSADHTLTHEDLDTRLGWCSRRSRLRAAACPLRRRHRLGSEAPTQRPMSPSAALVAHSRSRCPSRS